MNISILRSNTILLVAIVVALLAVLAMPMLTRTAAATPSSGVTATVLANGALSNGIRTVLKEPGNGPAVSANVSNIVTVRFDVQPGGSFGWHQHGGPIWAVISQGTLTLVHAEDCAPVDYPTGTSFLDPGNHTHIAVNNTEQPVTVIATAMLPQGAALRIDAPAPPNCSY